MEIGEMKPTAEVEYQIKAMDRDDRELPSQPLKLTVHFMGIDRGIDFAESEIKSRSDIGHAMIAKSIDIWDLNSKGIPIPLNDETKKLYIPYICAARTVDGKVVGIELASFILDSANFLKNS